MRSSSVAGSRKGCEDEHGQDGDGVEERSVVVEKKPCTIRSSRGSERELRYIMYYPAGKYPTR